MTPAVVVAIVSAMIATASLTYTVYDKRRSLSKRLEWQILTNAPLLTSQRWKELKVSLGQEEVTEPRVVALQISNSGRVELKRDDIAIGPRVTISGGKIMAAEVVLRTRGPNAPETIDPLRLTDTAVEIEGRLLNPGDSLLFRMLLDGGEERPSLAMQAAGFELVALPQRGSIEERQAVSRQERNARILGAITGGLTVIGTMVTAILISKP